MNADVLDVTQRVRVVRMPGEYAVRGALIDASGRARAIVRQRVPVLGSFGSDP